MAMPSLASVLSANGGYVDAAGYLALHGLFTAHVTGNFVTIGAALVFGTSGVIAKLAALPVFCAVVVLVRAVGVVLAGRGKNEFALFFKLKLLLLAGGCILAVTFGPFPDGDTWQAILTGMILVAAMAVQNAVLRIHLPTTPPTTAMTSNTTQLVIDAVDFFRRLPEEQGKQVRARIAKLGISVLSFAIGCATAAVLFYFLGSWCFVVPPAVGLVAARMALGIS